MRDVASESKERVKLVAGECYRTVGVAMYGKGLIDREPFVGGETTYKQLTPLRQGQLVLRSITAFEAPIAVVSESHAGAHVSGVFPVFDLQRDAIVPDFMSLICTSPPFWEAMRERTTGSVLRRMTLSAKGLLDIPIDLPPVDEQRRIVDVIGSVDAYIAALENQAEAARTARSALLDDLLSDPGPDWKFMEFADIASVDRGVAWSKDEESWITTDDSVPVVRIGNIQISGIDMSERLFITGVSDRDRERKAIQPTTILMVGSNGNPDRVGNAHLAGPSLAGHLYASFLIGITPFDGIVPEFLLATIQESGFQRAITEATSGSTGLKNIGLEWLRKFKVAVPGETKQRDIADVAHASDLLIGGLEAANANARSLRAALLSDLLSGNHEIPSSYDSLMGAA